MKLASSGSSSSSSSADSNCGSPQQPRRADKVTPNWAILARPTASTEAKSLPRSTSSNQSAKKYPRTDADEEVMNIMDNIKSQLHNDRHNYTSLDIQRITARVASPARSVRECSLRRSDSSLLVVERFGVPPHLWGRQKPASKELIERLVKPTTSHTQRRALTLKYRKLHQQQP